MKKLGIIIPTYNRPEYLRQCLDSLAIATFPIETCIYLIDDGSTNLLTKAMVEEFKHPEADVAFAFQEHGGVCKTLLYGITQAYREKCNAFMVLDADAVVRNDFAHVLIPILEHFPDHIVTGFNCNTLNRDGSIRHVIIEPTRHLEYGSVNFKKSVGGLNMLFTLITYESVINAQLQKAALIGGNWDHMVCIASMKKKRPIVCAEPSVVQHIGYVSAMGHSGPGLEEPDTADDFKPLSLPNVTLFGADCVDFSRLVNAAEASMHNIHFGDVKLLTDKDVSYGEQLTSSTLREIAVKIPPLKSREDYSRFMVKEMAGLIDTEFALVIQYDGYVLNYKSWDPEFLKYDYIGAPWWYKDGHNVGNGGFSLRSKRLMDVLAKDEFITETHPEDDVICRKYRKYLEEQYDIKFAPEELAKKFSVEGWKGDKSYVGQFGFHGHSVKKPEPVKFNPEKKASQTLIISQFQGIGDILFSMPLVNEWIDEGHRILWPVIDAYTNLNKHFPDVLFINKDLMNVDHNRKEEYDLHGAKVIPLRWADQILKLSYKDVMKAKYLMYGSNWRNWRNLKWKRDHVAENKIFKAMGLTEGQKFNLVNRHFRSDQTGLVDIQINNGLPNIEMRNIPGTTLLDWAKVIEAATEIHTVHTAIVYIIDVLETTDKLHQYLRKPDEKDFAFTDYLWKKKYQYHF